jgi:hypothetical protein
MFHIEGNYFESLKNSKSIKIQRTVKPPPGSSSSPTIITHIIPPLNTDININTLPVYSQKNHIGQQALIATNDMPKIWDWRHNYPTDDKTMIDKKKLIEPPPNQALCGSCWAVASATVISDNFVAMGLVKYNPKISTTYSLSCYPQLRCKGGAPAILMDSIVSGGIADDTCVDYSWCLKNDKCNGTQKLDEDFDMDSLIPNMCGCYIAREHYKYYITDPESISITPSISQDDFIYKVKNHIYTNGSVLGTYSVFSNFIKGEFTGINDGVYLENCDYTDNKLTFSQPGQPVGNYLGGHAVSIIGWGISNIQVDNDGTKEDVPYWYVRNSWTSTWGSDEGYFKMAMYPYNQISQFDKQIDITDDAGNRISGGGIILLSAGSREINKDFGLNDYSGELLKNDDYYNSLPQPDPNGGGDDNGGDNGDDNGGDKGDDNGGDKKSNILLIIGIIICCIIGIILVYYITKGVIKYLKSKPRNIKIQSEVIKKPTISKVILSNNSNYIAKYSPTGIGM